MATKNLAPTRNNRSNGHKKGRSNGHTVAHVAIPPRADDAEAGIVDASVARAGAAVYDRIQTHTEAAIDLATDGEFALANLAIDRALECVKAAQNLDAFETEGEYAAAIHQLATIRKSLAVLV